MAVKDTMLKVLCVSLCVAWSLSSPSEESIRDSIEHVLSVPNPDKVLNSVLGRLEKHRENTRSRPRLTDEADCIEPFESLPEYTQSRQLSRERGLRQLDIMKYYPICHLERKIRRLNTDEYEYRPAFYEEIICTSTPEEEFAGTNEICSSLGFTCVQWNKTIHLTRRRYTSDCWETRTMVIPAGCECMWPFHRLGDMTLHI
ncbi:hypothetical protein O0L34_g2502 [Tuta absoluta]|nr:hypothetical protein O0L34_g2502 [Tuta absoluta]